MAGCLNRSHTAITICTVICRSPHVAWKRGRLCDCPGPGRGLSRTKVRNVSHVSALVWRKTMSARSARPFPATLFCPATTCACEHVSVQVGEGGWCRVVRRNVCVFILILCVLSKSGRWLESSDGRPVMTLQSRAEQRDHGRPSPQPLTSPLQGQALMLSSSFLRDHWLYFMEHSQWLG